LRFVDGGDAACGEAVDDIKGRALDVLNDDGGHDDPLWMVDNWVACDMRRGAASLQCEVV
jgi:hypothetical protein